MESGTASLSHWGDILALVLYFAVLFGIAILSVVRSNRSTTHGFFLAGRAMQWWTVGASLFGSNIGSEHFIGLAGTGAASGLAIVLYEWTSLPLVMMLSWFFLPVYLSAGVYTLPEYLQKRFGGERLRVYASCVSLCLYIITKVAVCIYAGGFFIRMAVGWDLYLSIVALLAVTCCFTALGGLTAVIYTDTVQIFIMMIGCLFLTIKSFSEVGGYQSLERRYAAAIPEVVPPNSTCGTPRDDAFHLFRDAETGDLPSPGLVLQSTIGCLWYWCADQVIVQRALAAKSLEHAKGAAILTGYLKLTPLFLIVMPGMISRVLYPDDVACVLPEECERACGNPVGCSNMAYPLLVVNLLPVGWRGLQFAVMLCAIISSLTSIFNSASTLFTMDLWRRLRQWKRVFESEASERELLIVGRIFILILCGVSISWIPLIQSSQGGQLFNYIQAVQGYIGTPIGALFICAVFSTRVTELGAFSGIVVGHVMGVTRMIVDFAYPAPTCGETDERPLVLSAIHYSHFGPMVLIVTFGVTFAVSYMTKPPTTKELEGVTWWTKKTVDTVTSHNALDTATKHDAIDNGVDSEKNMDELSKAKEVQEMGLPLKSLDHNEPDPDQTKGPDQLQPSLAIRFMHHLCGAPSSGQVVQPVMAVAFTKSKWDWLLNVNAALAFAVMAFLIGFYA